MSTRRWGWPETSLVSGLAALTTWVTMLAWVGFAEQPSGYLVPLFGIAILVAASGALLRAARLPAPLVLAIQVVALAVILHHSWGGAQALGGWIPTDGSLHAVGKTIADAVNVSQSYAAPVPRTVPQFDPLMVLAGTAALVLVDFLAGGLRRAPLAGLPLLAIYAAPVSIIDGGVSWLKFTVDAVCFVFLLASEEAGRLARWGHQVGGSRLFDSQETSVSTQAVWASARKIGFTATAVAVVLPLLLPSLGGGLLTGHGNGPGGHGGSVNIANPLVDMRRDLVRGSDEPLVRVVSPQDPSYLRLTVLDQFDGTEWQPSDRAIPVSQRAEGVVPQPPGLDPAVPTRRVPYEIAAGLDFRSRWLPAPYPVYSIHAPGDWRYDAKTLDFISAANGQTTAGLSYRVVGLDVEPTATELADAGPAKASVFEPNTQLPRGFPESIRTLAEKVTKGARSQHDEAVMLQDWFRTGGGFKYSLHRAPGNGIKALVQFLGTGPGSRIGYCEQFAAAMATMGRALGIPSRVAVGFLHPSQTGFDHYVFSSHDLHAWPEMYFSGAGWMRFEPTPASRTGTGPETIPAYAHLGTPAKVHPTHSSGPSQAPSLNRFNSPSGAVGVQRTRPNGGGGTLRANGYLPGLLGVLVLALLLVAPRLIRALVRNRRWATARGAAGLTEAAWAELRDSALDHGLVWDDSVTLRTRARDLTRCFGVPGAEQDALGRAPSRGAAANPEAARAVDRLVRRLERVRYARTGLDPQPAEAIRADTETCVAALRSGASASTRLRGTWLPRSLWLRLFGAGRMSRPITTRLATDGGVDRAV